MPLFSSRKNTSPTTTTTAPVTTSNHYDTKRTSTGGGGFFSSNRHRRSSSLSSSDLENNHTRHHHTHNTTTSTGTGGTLSNLFHRNGNHTEDPTLAAAQQRVLAAEEAEREADRALAAARLSVRQAREHVKALELEAKEEARLARIKQQGARDLGKRAKPLGRHSRY